MQVFFYCLLKYIKRYDNALLGLPYALASQSFCKSFNLDLLEASATLTLTELWFARGSSHAKRALSLVYQSLPMIIGHGGLELRARARIVLAKCHLSDPKFSVWEDPSVLDPLNQAAEDLQSLEYHEMAAEAYYLKARAYNHIGKLDESEEAAAYLRSMSLPSKARITKMIHLLTEVTKAEENPGFLSRSEYINPDSLCIPY